MSDHTFAISVLNWLWIVMAVIGMAVALEHIFERRPRRRREYRMRYDRHDDKRRIEHNGLKTWLGLR